MTSAATVAALCGLLFNIALSQVKPAASLQPTRLEAFAGQPTAKVTWSKAVGQIESDEARAIVTALMIKNSVQPPQQMCGVRIDLANKHTRDQVYLEEANLGAARKALEEIDERIEGYRKELG